MSWLSGLLARLFGAGKRRRPVPLDLSPAAAPEAGEPAPPPVPELPAALGPGLPELPPLPEGVAVIEVEEGEDAFEEEELSQDAPAPFDALDASEVGLDSRPDLDVIVAERLSRLEENRREAEREALSGERRVRLTDAAGPGTLAETLARLEREGRLISRLDEGEGGPVLVYTPHPPPEA